jgi:hypothetical protein
MNYGALGPLEAGDEARLTYGGVGGNAVWTPDGRGIVISLKGCIDVLPAAGGSVTRFATIPISPSRHIVTCHARPRAALP